MLSSTSNFFNTPIAEVVSRHNGDLIMEDTQFQTPRQDAETLAFKNDGFCVSGETLASRNVDFCNNGDFNSPMDVGDEDLQSIICDSGSRLTRGGSVNHKFCEDDVVIFVNSGGQVSSDSCINNRYYSADAFFEGGNVFRTDERISAGGGDNESMYQTARLGNFCYRFKNISPGNYVIDLHFAEIINTNGPRGIRVFNVYIQEDKVLHGFDIFAVVGANKPLQLVDTRVSVKDDGLIIIRFEGVNGSPLVSGVCIRKSTKISVESDPIVCESCAAMVRVPSAHRKRMRAKATLKYERKIHELDEQCKNKTHECYEAWMSLNRTNEQLEKVRMELDNKSFQTYSLEERMQKQAGEYAHILKNYQTDKVFWNTAISDMEVKVKTLAQNHAKLSYDARQCADSVPDLNKMVSAVQSLVFQCEDLKMKYCEEQLKRKKLYNEIQEAKGNIRVFCRCRPMNREEISSGIPMAIDIDAAKDGDIGVISGVPTRKTFKFDRVYTPKDNQVDVFSDASPMVVSVLDGFNVCIFAFGQTGTGKTFTMEGNEQNRGVNYRTLDELFRVIAKRHETCVYDVSVSVVEVYNEQIRDLLATSSSKKLEIKQASEGFHHIPGIVEAKVKNVKEVWHVLQVGTNARAVGSNNVNEHSSRSHCMLCIMVKAKNLMNGECTKSKLWLVDLAGSERLSKTEAQGDRLKEAQSINKSLSALGDVISALANRSSHVPYRNSKLTHLLQDSLGGDSKTLMFVQISPSESDARETLSSLNFATRVRGVELGPSKKQFDNGELQKIKTELDKTRQELRAKEEYLRRFEGNLEDLESKIRSKDQICKTHQEKIKELEFQLENQAGLWDNVEKQTGNLSEQLKLKEQSCCDLQHKVFELENKMKEQIRESESHSLVLQQRIKDVEQKLKDKELNYHSSLHQKVKELEQKVEEKEALLGRHTSTAEATASRSTSHSERKRHSRDEPSCDTEPNILRESNPATWRTSHGSREERRWGGDTENRRQPDPQPKGYPRGSGARPPPPAAMAAPPQRLLSSSQSGKKGDEAERNKSRNTRKRIWSR